MAAVTKITSLGQSEFTDLVNYKFIQPSPMIEQTEKIKSLFIVENIPQGTGDRKRYIEEDTELYARYKAESANASKVRVTTGWSKDCINRRFAAEIEISYEMRTQGKDRAILNKLTSLAHYYPQRLQLDLTHRITFATATSYTDMDGETVDTSMGYTTTTALADSTHDLTVSSSTYSTVITGNPLPSQGAFETAMDLTDTQILDNFGNKRTLNFNKVFCHNKQSSIRVFKQLFESMGDVDGAHAGIMNAHMGEMELVVLPYLATTATGAHDSTKVNYWGLVAAQQWQAYLGIWEQNRLISPAPGNNGEDVHTDDWTYGSRGGHGICVLSGRGFLLSTGLGA